MSHSKLKWILEQMNGLENLDGKNAIHKEERKRKLIEAYNFVHKSKTLIVE